MLGKTTTTKHHKKTQTNKQNTNQKKQPTNPQNPKAKNDPTKQKRKPNQPATNQKQTKREMET